MVAIIELILVLVFMKIIAEIGVVGTCLLFGVFYGIEAIFVSAGLLGVLNAFLVGIVHGFFAYLIAILCLFLIKFLGALGVFLIGLLFFFALIAIII